MRRREAEKRNWTQVGGLIVLTIVTIVLVLLVFKDARPDVPNAGQTPGYVATPAEKALVEDAQSPQEAPTGEDSSPPEETATVSELSRVLGVQDGNVAYRAATGPCPQTAAVVEITQDGGGTWTPFDLGIYGSVRSLVRLIAGTDGFAYVATQDGTDCNTIQILQSYNYGTAWEIVPDGAALTWHINPSDATVLRGPQVGDVQAPCEVARIASATATDVAVVCSDARLASSVDAGANWTLLGPFPGAESMASTGDGYLLASTGVADCAGTKVSKFTVDLLEESSTCVADVVAPGETAVAAGDGAVWLWAGDTIRRSLDGGVSWKEEKL